jgi:hypothetical protein
MGIVASRAQYESAIKKLFPQGGYWDEQFADPESDVSLFVKAKLEELIRFRGRMSALYDESRIETTDELIADWERVLLENVNYGKTLTERRLLLKSKEDNRLNRAELEKIAGMYGLFIADIAFPCRPGFFGFSRFNTSFIGSPAAFSVLLITALQEDFRAKVWAMIREEFTTQRFGTIHFGLDRLVYFPAYKLRLLILKLLRKSATGFFRLGVNRLFPSPSYRIRPLVGKRLAASSFGFAGFGVNRLVYSPIPAMRRIVTDRIWSASAGFMRCGFDRLIYTSMAAIRETVHRGLRLSAAGLAKFGVDRVLPVPLDKIQSMLWRQFRPACLGFIRFGLSRLAEYSGEYYRMARFGAARFGRSRIVHYDNTLHFIPLKNTGRLFEAFIKNLVQKSGVVPRSDARIVGALIRDSGFPPRFDTGLTGTLIRQDGLIERFNIFFMRKTLGQIKFFPRLEQVLINRMIAERQLFSDFERAIQEKLLANQIAYFKYEGA